MLKRLWERVIRKLAAPIIASERTAAAGQERKECVKDIMSGSTPRPTDAYWMAFRDGYLDGRKQSCVVIERRNPNLLANYLNHLRKS
jgi:hypothetical protein